MDSKGIFEALQAKFGEDVVFGYEPPKLATLDDHFFVHPDRIVELLTYLRDDPAYDFDYLECLSGVDYPDAPMAGPSAPPEGEEAEKGTIHVVYHLRSYDKKHRAVVKVSLPRSDPRVSTVSTVWSAANWQERECFDLLGVLFTGHPDLRRIMLPDDWIGHPLRKDYQEESSYQGIPTTRPNPLDLLTITKPAAARAEAKPKPEAKPKAEAKPQAEAKPKSEAKPKPEADKAEAKTKTDKDAEAKPKSEAKPKADKDDAEAKPEADKAEAKTKTDDGDAQEPKKDDKPVDEKG